VISIVLNAILVYFYLKEEEVDRTPFWHPFELNSELTLESIVENGYRFAFMPCGQVQYTKQIGDTIIQYEVEIDCNKYNGKYQRPTEYVEEDESKENTLTKEKSKNTQISRTFEEEREENKYYPWKLGEISDCYQDISYRVFTISLGSSIDSSFVRNFVSKNGGYILSTTESWDTKSGGSFMVSHEESDLHFYCNLRSENYYDTEETNWQFEIVSSIPRLNQKSIIKEKNWQEKKNKYYEE
jgi:hypothetical protein